MSAGLGFPEVFAAIEAEGGPRPGVVRAAFAEILAAPPHYPAPDRALVAIPTTAGTGSEVSGGAVVTDLAANVSKLSGVHVVGVRLRLVAA